MRRIKAAADGLLRSGAHMLQVDPAVSAAVHYVSSLYFKAQRDFAEFYKSSLQYLAFVSSDTLDHDFKLVILIQHILWHGHGSSSRLQTPWPDIYDVAVVAVGHA